MKINVAVLFGGESVEHEVSIISAVQAMRFLDRDKYHVIPLYMSKDHQIYHHEDLVKIESYVNLKNLLEKAIPVVLYRKNDKVFYRDLNQKSIGKNPEFEIDVALPIIHGTNGEDGTVQGFLEMLGLPYSGCNVIAAGVGQDKVFMKHVLAGNNLPIVPWLWFDLNQYKKDATRIFKQAQELGYPLIVKPACLGSSVGISMAHDEAELKDAIKLAFEFDYKLVVEKVVSDLIEVNCSVFGDGVIVEASALEQVGQGDFLSYQDKYQGKNGKSKGMVSTARIIPAPLSETLTQKIQELAKASFIALGASGVSRIDFLLNQKTQEIFVNEINTIPGSLAFYLWEASGVKYPALLDKLITQAITKERLNKQLTFSFETNILESFSTTGCKGIKK